MSATYVQYPAAQAAPPVIQPLAEAEEIARLVERLGRIDGVDPARIQVVRAPLRICPLGAHIDHQLGVVTGMTIDRAILLAFVPTLDGRVQIESLNFDRPARFGLEQVPPYQKGDWANYVRGAVLALQQRHRLAQGLVGVVGGAMPIGGLSSSAAVTIAYLLALEAINGLSLGAQDNVELCRFTENRYIGLNNGILDQSVILHSATGHLTRIDCQTVEIDRVPAGLDAAQLSRSFEVLVVYSGVTHALVGTDYNNRVAECRQAAQELLGHAGLPVPDDVRLRHVPEEQFSRHVDRLDAPLARRARHYFGEMARVAEGVSAWRSGDLAGFGRLVTESGESSIKWYECGCPQLVTLYEILRETPGVYGTRFSGAGFRGNCIALIDRPAREAIAEAVHGRYPALHPDVAGSYSIHFCQPDGPASLVTTVPNTLAGQQAA
jgi:galactokinase/galacturonokinase